MNLCIFEVVAVKLKERYYITFASFQPYMAEPVESKISYLSDKSIKQTRGKDTELMTYFTNIIHYDIII